MSVNIVEQMKELLSEMKRTFSVEAAIGEPMSLEDKTIIPVAKMSFGAGGGSGSGGEGEGSGSGFGVGGGVEPVAFLIVYRGVPGKEGVQLMELRPKGKLWEIASAIAPMVMRMMGRKETTPEQEKEKEELMAI